MFDHSPVRRTARLAIVDAKKADSVVHIVLIMVKYHIGDDRFSFAFELGSKKVLPDLISI